MPKGMDSETLLLCEDLSNTLRQGREQIHAYHKDKDVALMKRLDALDRMIASERRLIEEVSLPCRYIVAHFSLLLHELEYTIGFSFRDIRSGRGLLNQLEVGEWGTVSLRIGDVSLQWRDADAVYMFYPDKAIVRQKASAEDDITFILNYPFTYANDLLKAYQGVAQDEKTLYWHESLSEEIE